MTMRFVVGVFGVLTTLLGAAACADGGGEPSDPSEEPDQNEPIINGVPASEYYDQFVWASSHTHVVGQGSFSDDPSGRNAFSIQMFLLPDGEAQVFYWEGVEIDIPQGTSTTPDATTKTTKHSTWSVDGDTLRIGSLMHCDGLTSSGHPALACQLDAAIVSEQAVDRLVILVNQYGENSPDDPEFDGFEDAR